MNLQRKSLIANFLQHRDTLSGRNKVCMPGDAGKLSSDIWKGQCDKERGLKRAGICVCGCEQCVCVVCVCV